MKPMLPLFLCLAVFSGCASKGANEVQEPAGQEYYDMSTLAAYPESGRGDSLRLCGVNKEAASAFFHVPNGVSEPKVTLSGEAALISRAC